MTRRLHLAIFFLLFCAGTAWPKWDKEDKAYLVSQFRTLQDQLQALKTQVDTLGAQLAEMRQNQAQLQAVIIRQQRALQDMDQLVSSMRLSHEDNFSTLKAELTKLRTEQQKAATALTSQPATVATEVAPPSKPVLGLPVTAPGVQGYITVITGNTVTVDLGAAKGLRQGSRLAVYKANDQNARVGVLEVTEVVDAENSRARIVTMNPGIRPEFSDIVRLE